MYSSTVARTGLLVLRVILSNPILDILHLSIINGFNASVGIGISQQHIAAVSSSRDNSNGVLRGALQRTSRSPRRRRRSRQPRVDLANSPHQALGVGVVPPAGDPVDARGGEALGDADFVFALGGEPELALAFDVFLGDEFADDALASSERADGAPVLESGAC